MADRIMRYRTEIDVAQAQQQARVLAQTFVREMSAAQSQATAAAGAAAPAMSGGRGGSGIGALAAFGAVGAGMLGGALSIQAAKGFAVEMGSLSVQVRRSEQAFVALSGSGAEAEKRLKAIQSAAGGTMGNLQAMNLANRLVSLGMANSAQEMEKAVSTGRKIATVMGGDVTSALENLSLAAANLSYMRLDQMGISATQVRNRVKELTEANKELGKEQAFLQAAMEVANKNFAGIDTSTAAAVSGLERLGGAWSRTMEQIAAGPVGSGANAGFGYLAGSIDALFGNDSSKIAEARRRFETQRAMEGGWSANSWVPDIAKNQGQGDAIAATFKSIDDAITAGIPNIDAYLERTAEIASVWTGIGNILPAQVRELEEIQRVIASTEKSTSAYQRSLDLLGREFVEGNTDAQAIAGEMAKLDMLLAAGVITNETYMRSVQAISVALGAMAGNAQVAASDAAALAATLKDVRAQDYLYMITGGANGQSSGPLTREAMERVNQSRYGGMGNQGFVMDQYGAPTLDPKTGQMVKQPWALGYMPGWNDGSLQGEWDHQVREENIKKAAEERDRVAREEEEAARKWQQAADQTAREMEAAAKRMAAEFESSLRKIPGLFGTSGVTADDMAMAEMGIYTEKADEWLRQLSDEVINKVDRPGVDITDAKARAGLDPAMDDKAALALISSMWADSSLFAGGKNLDLINQNAVQANLARQDASKSGQQAILDMLGLPGAGAAAKGAGAGMGDSGDIGDAVMQDPTKLADVMQAQLATEEVTKKLKDIGDGLAGAIHQGWVEGISARDWRAPIVDGLIATVTAGALANINDAMQE